ncbi:serine-type exopeptidase [Malassezia pachydermatis]
MRPSVAWYTSLRNHAGPRLLPDEAPTPTPSNATYQLNTLEQPLDHFGSSTQTTFLQHYALWMDDFHAGSALRTKTPDGREIVPVFVHDTGESTLAQEAQHYNSTILKTLASKTGGIGIFLEHRYYGQSQPRLSDLGNATTWGVDQLQWLNLEQSLEDSVQFLQKVQLPDLPPNADVRFLYHGGSYAGGRAAFLRTRHPDLVFGAISTSGVVAPTVELPNYYYSIVENSDPICMQNLQAAIGEIDQVITPDPRKGSNQTDLDTAKVAALLHLFGLTDDVDLTDFANALTAPLSAFQMQTWQADRPESPWNVFCDTMKNASLAGMIKADFMQDWVTLGNVSDGLLSYSAYFRSVMNGECQGKDLTACVQARPDEFRDDQGQLSANKAWYYQTCTEYGLFQTAPPMPDVTASPPHLSGPKIVSSRLDVNYSQQLCQRGFTPGQKATMPPYPNVTKVLQYGNVHLAYDRLAFINAQRDPWLPVTVHSNEYAFGGARNSTTMRPFLFIPDCWHTCDWIINTDLANEPDNVKSVQQTELQFVQEWLKA